MVNLRIWVDLLAQQAGIFHSTRATFSLHHRFLNIAANVLWLTFLIYLAFAAIFNSTFSFHCRSFLLIVASIISIFAFLLALVFLRLARFVLLIAKLFCLPNLCMFPHFHQLLDYCFGINIPSETNFMLLSINGPQILKAECKYSRVNKITDFFGSTTSIKDRKSFVRVRKYRCGSGAIIVIVGKHRKRVVGKLRRMRRHARVLWEVPVVKGACYGTKDMLFPHFITYDVYAHLKLLRYHVRIRRYRAPTRYGCINCCLRYTDTLNFQLMHLHPQPTSVVTHRIICENSSTINSLRVEKGLSGPALVVDIQIAFSTAVLKSSMLWTQAYNRSVLVSMI
nr:hypothetical protein Iba_chr07bCG0540 [Ipomoea batatas]